MFGGGVFSNGSQFEYLKSNRTRSIKARQRVSWRARQRVSWRAFSEFAAGVVLVFTAPALPLLFWTAFFRGFGVLLELRRNFFNTTPPFSNTHVLPLG